MNPVQQAVVWLNDPLNWTNPGGVLDRVGEHLSMSVAAVLLGCLVAWPVGLWLGHSGRGGGAVVLISNLTLSIPTLALLTILPLTFLGFGRPAVVVALAVFAVPPLLANAYTGVRQADPEARDAARGMGLSGWQVLRRVELPLAVPYLAAGFRTAAVQVVATAALASFVNGGGLGQIIRAGFGLDIAAGGGQIIAGGVLVAGLALAAEGLLALVERVVTPRPLRRTRRVANRRAADATAGN
ncbi:MULTISPECIES: ABC transporter permease [Micromonospora]|uniref:ABC transporter permease subunit n=1 Tax=Micromonospora antibiotica TaxID=2807623 RepID=A0ABS3V913_9ACTN|nr:MULTISPECIES: ABC transporter permease subunit [Micromonospora]MBO4162103.1 ABC transporter permease subunit [Micromonospora antibiotica]MBW4703618.1 ABC transporter permease subunit [Micromonospora sp. RL09-050-HVF-A]